MQGGYRSEIDFFEKYLDTLKESGYEFPQGSQVTPREKYNTVEQYLEYLRHLAAYILLAEELTRNKLVLEIGCGTGYGAAYLSKSARGIIATDIWKEGISYCKALYEKDNLTFLLADGLKLPFESDFFDVVISFQVIEHIEPRFVLEYLNGIKKVLKKGGLFICSTPNKRLRLLPFQKPWNPAHKCEYNREELKRLLNKVFEKVKIYGLVGSKEVQDIERNRVKQNPFDIYITKPAYKLLFSHLPSPIDVQIRKIKEKFSQRNTSNKPLLQEDFINKFSLNDFRIDQACPKDCIDLYAICAKVTT